MYSVNFPDRYFEYCTALKFKKVYTRLYNALLDISNVKIDTIQIGLWLFADTYKITSPDLTKKFARDILLQLSEDMLELDLSFNSSSNNSVYICSNEEIKIDQSVLDFYEKHLSDYILFKTTLEKIANAELLKYGPFYSYILGCAADDTVNLAKNCLEQIKKHI